MDVPSHRPRRVARAVAALALAALGNALAATPPSEWSFTVRLDGKPIGTHRFVLASAGDESLSLTNGAQFESRRSASRCIATGTASASAGPTAASRRSRRSPTTTGVTEVQGRALQDRFDLQVRYDGRPEPAPAGAANCVMSFAYWNPALSDQKRLLDPVSGRIEPVVIAAMPATPADLDGQAQPARGLRIGGLAQAIDVWYVGNRWLGLDIVVGGRRLSYRLR